jgi:chemotaxis protein CheD
VDPGTLTVPAAEVHVNVGDAAVLQVTGVLSSIGLGSCIALVLYDRATRIGGLAHILLPHEALSRVPGKASKYATTAVTYLLAQMREAATLVRPEARLVGGASMFANLLKGGGINMGERNVIATRRALAAAGVPIVGEAVGGDFGRSVFLDIATGQLRVTSIQHGERLL